MSEKERRITAYHEMGHALVAHFLENTDPVHKISVISRGQALGYTISLPTEDKFLTTRAELPDTMAMTLGGRAAEEIVFSEVTTGASNDLEKVTATAKQMVMRFGMSEKLGPRVFGHDHGQPFLGREFSSEPDYSDEIAREIDDEIRRIVEEAHQSARDILEQHREELDAHVRDPAASARRSSASSSWSCSTGKTEEEVFGPRRAGRCRAGSAPAARRGAERAQARAGPDPAAAAGTRRRRRRRLTLASCLAVDGRRQRDARLVLGRRAVPRRRRRGRPRRAAGRRRAPRSSTSAASRPGPARSRCREAVELERVVPVVERLAAAGAARVSIDTSKLAVARAALDAGATIVNDVSAFRFAPELAGAGRRRAARTAA